MELFYIEFEQLLFIFARIGGFLFAAPVFSSQSIPPQIKAGLAMLISFIVFPYVKVMNVDLGPYMLNFAIYMLGEIAIGVILGLVCEFYFSAVRFSGEILGQNIGFSMVNVIDPQTQQQVSLLGFFNYSIALIVFMSVNGHHVFIKAISKSFDYINLGSFHISSGLLEEITRLFCYFFYLGFQIALPILSTMLIITVALGFVAKAIPQIQVFLISFPLKILTGLITYVLFMPVFTAFLIYVYNRLYEEMYLCLKLMG